jgi:acyl-lipid omega-6 desaturase (Delta-12 desaturase)
MQLSTSQRVRVAAIRKLYAALALGSVKLSSRLATQRFLSSRGWLERPQKPALPLGARIMSLPDGSPIRQAYVWGRSGPRVVLVHGWGVDSRSMYGFVKPLTAAGFQVIAFDAPAHGINSGHGTTMTAYVAGIRAVLDAAGEVWAVIGHSLGGLASVAAINGEIKHAPERLVLISAPCTLAGALPSFAKFWHLDSAVQRGIRHELLIRNGVPIEHWDMRSLARPEPIDTLVVHDHGDTFVPVHEAAKIEAALSARVELTQELGHTHIISDRRILALTAEFLRPRQTPDLAVATNHVAASPFERGRTYADSQRLVRSSTQGRHRNEAFGAHDLE